MQFKTEFSDKQAEAYINGGSGEEVTINENLESIAKLRIVPRVLRNIESVDTSIKDQIGLDRSPIVIGPTAFHQLASAQAELATSTAASKTKTPYIISCYASMDIHSLVKNIDKNIYWQQLYIFDDKQITEKILDHAETYDAKAIVVTVGAAVSGNRNREKKADWKIPKDFIHLVENANHLESFELSQKLSKKRACWKDIEWLRSKTNLPIVLKGILDKNDAKMAFDHGCDAIVVTNHGGRQMDGVVNATDVIQEIRQELGPQFAIYVGDGYCTGTDILKALALGANRVLLGKPIIWKLNENGADGLESYLEDLIVDLSTMMKLCGCSNTREASTLRIISR